MVAILNIFGYIGTAWRAFWWLRSEKKKMEADVDAYLTDENCDRLRLNLEKFFKALDEGKVDRLPKKWQGVAKRVFPMTTIENRIGHAGQRVLKSGKLSRNDPILRQNIYPAH